MAHRRRSILPVTRTSNKIVVPAATPSTETTTAPLATDTVTTPMTAPNAAVSETTTAAASTTPDTSTTTTARAPRAPRRPDPKHSMRRRSAVPFLLRLGLSMTAAAAESSSTGESESSTKSGAEEVTLVEGKCGGEIGRNDAENDSEGVSGVQRACGIDVWSPAKGDDAAEVVPRLEEACDDAKPVDWDDSKPIDCDDAKPTNDSDTKPTNFQNDANPTDSNDAKPSWTSALVTDDEVARWTRLMMRAACDEVCAAVESGDSEDVKGVIERGTTGPGTRKRRCPWQPFALPRPSSAPCA